ncbi:Metallo-dependent phosphatase-like protein [Coemansia spiralis]|nr:Metallo-dependent phosphatase-like protein [Coemansia spiralis]
MATPIRHLRLFKLVVVILTLLTAAYTFVFARLPSSANAPDSSTVKGVRGKLNGLGLSPSSLPLQHNLAAAPAYPVRLYKRKKHKNDDDTDNEPGDETASGNSDSNASTDAVTQFRASDPTLLISRTFDPNNAPQRLIFIGDIHGSVDQFNNLLDAVNFRQGSDQVILVGDLVAKGPDSIGVIRKAQSINAWATRGNHDDRVIRWREFLDGPGVNLTTSDIQGLEDNGELPYSDFKLSALHYEIARSLSPDDLAYIKSFSVVMTLPEPYMEWVVVHGGLDPSKPILKQDSDNCMNMRNIDSSGPVSTHKDGQAWFDVYAAKMETLTQPASPSSIGSEDFSQINFNKVVYGHDAGRSLQIHEYTKGLDSRCVYGGNLTAFILPGEKLVSVPCPDYDGSVKDDK